MPKINTEILGQYTSDYEIHAGAPNLGADPHGVLSMRGDGNVGLHHSMTLYDEGAGLYDEATGNTQRDPTTVEEDLLTLEGIRLATYDELLHEPKLESDAADAWLVANDPNHGKIGV